MSALTSTPPACTFTDDDGGAGTALNQLDEHSEPSISSIRIAVYDIMTRDDLNKTAKINMMSLLMLSGPPSDISCTLKNLWIEYENEKRSPNDVGNYPEIVVDMLQEEILQQHKQQKQMDVDALLAKQMQIQLYQRDQLTSKN